MRRNPRSRTSIRGYAVLLAINLVLFIFAAEIVDLLANDLGGLQTFLGAGLVILLLVPAAWFWRRMQQRGGAVANTGPDPLSPQLAQGAVLLLVLVATSLRFYQLGTESLWFDEIWTINSSSQPAGAILRAANALPILTTRLFRQLSRSEYVMRFAPALSGVLTVPAVYQLGRTLCGRREGLVAAFLFAVAPHAIYHSQEVRYYAWQMLFSTLSLYYLLQGLQRGRIADWVGFGLSTLLNINSHPTGFLVLGAEGMYVAYVLTADLQPPELHEHEWWGRLKAWLRRAVPPMIAGSVPVLAYIPLVQRLAWLKTSHWFGAFGAGGAHGIAGPTAAQPLYDYMELTHLSDPVIYWTHGLFGLFTASSRYLVLFYVLLSLMLLGLVSSRRRTALLVLLCILLPVPIVLATRARIFPRYLSFFLPLIVIVIGRGATHLADAFKERAKMGRVLLALVVLLAAAPSLVELSRYYSQPDKEQWRELTAKVDAAHQPGDFLLASSLYRLTILPFDWYSSVPQSALPRQPFPEGGVLTSLSQIDALPQVTDGYSRVWFVMVWQKPEVVDMIVASMERSFALVEEHSYVGLELLLFQAAPLGSGP
jgi:4-amino-4-deoxy-L-arabinose transferase-like glycosyltransferase